MSPLSSTSSPAPRPASLLTVALALAAFAAALLAPAQTLAHAHRSRCPHAHATSKCGAPACKQSSRKRKGHHTGKCATRRASAPRAGAPLDARSRAKKRHSSPSQPLAEAQCANSSPPVSSGEGSFTCEDGSEPQCEDGAIPTPRSSLLVCPVIFEEESSSGEAECEEEETCAGASTPAGAPCEEASDEGSSSQCEAEG